MVSILLLKKASLYQCRSFLLVNDNCCFCFALHYCREKIRVFLLIDEPELSLNIKWQRALVDELMNLVAGSEMQIIMATHSIELVAQHGAHVQTLN